MQATRKIAVAGATGRVGRHVVDVLDAGGHDVVAMSRSSGVDVVTGDGLAEALAGVECVIDAATGPSPDQQAATEFFTAAAWNLQEAGERAGRPGPRPLRDGWPAARPARHPRRPDLRGVARLSALACRGGLTVKDLVPTRAGRR